MDVDGLSALLGALLSGAGGEAGKQAIASLQALVHRYRPPRQARAGDQEAAAAGGPVGALAQLSESPSDGVLLRRVLAELDSIATTDPEFAQELAEWYDASSSRVGRAPSGNNVNTISGGTFHAPVTQGYQVDARPERDPGW